MADCKTHQKLKIIVKPVPVSQYHKSKTEFYNQSREPYTQKGAHMDAAQILKPFANEHIPTDTEKTATAEHTSEIITMQNVNKSYKMGSGSLHVLKDISLTVEQGEYLAILGPSGSGKSTLMNIIGCMDVLDEGTYNLDGVEIEKAKEKELTNIRNQKIGFIFQKYHLIPTYNVLQNIVMPLLMRGMTLKDARDASMDTIAMLGLAERIDHKPNELSGGQQQRVAIARALVKMPRVLLLDEPLSNLDARLRLQTREEIRKIQRATKITTVFVTHDQEEAMSISDMIVVMKSGVVQQIGKPQDVYDSPVNLFVARFLGTPPINVFEGEIRGQKLYIGENAILDAPGISDQQVFAGIRPEGFVLDKNGPLCCQLGGVEVMGRDISVVSSHAASQAPAIRSIISSESSIDLSSKTIRFAVKPNKIFLFGRETEERIYL